MIEPDIWKEKKGLSRELRADLCQSMFLTYDEVVEVKVANEKIKTHIFIDIQIEIDFKKIPVFR